MLVLKMRKDNAKRAALIGAARLFSKSCVRKLQFRSSSNQSLASVVRREFLEVLYEARG